MVFGVFYCDEADLFRQLKEGKRKSSKVTIHTRDHIHFIQKGFTGI